MAEARRLTDLVHGHVGRLTYLPPDDPTSQPGTLHTGRASSQALHFRVIGSSAELYPPSKTSVPEGASNLWQERRTQRRWLLQAHPEAFMGNSALQDLLEENMNRYSKVEGEASDRPLIAMGQMTNVGDPSRITGAAMLAAVTGESGELLRLARIDESRWTWGHTKDAALNLAVIDPEDPEEEVIWASDGLPISQVKFATSLSRYDVVRWVLVQKHTSTTLLEPQYHKVPVSQRQAADPLVPLQRLSRIDPNPIISLSHKQTGGNAHVDVAFNPGFKDQPPQIAVMDECGYWSVWDVQGVRKNNPRLAIHKQGHISEGLLDSLPSVPSFPAGKHGLLFVGTAEMDSFWNDDPSQGPEEAGQFAIRSQHLLLWNQEKYEVIDLVSSSALPKLPILVHTRAQQDCIIDMMVNPVNQNQVFILTLRNLFWVDLFVPSKGEEASSKQKILVACPHLTNGDGLRMTSCRTSEGGRDVAMVVTFSPQHRQIHAYWFEQQADKGLTKWHRQVLTLPYENDSTTAQLNIQSLVIHSAKLSLLDGQATGSGSAYCRDDVQFYQGSILGSDLSIRYCICASARRRSLEVALPTARMKHTTKDQTHRWKRKRRHFLRHMGDAFVLPDVFAETNMDTLVKPAFLLTNDLASADASALGPINLNLQMLCQAIYKANTSLTTDPQHDIPPRLLAAIEEMIAEGVDEGRLPLKTWKEINKELDHREPDMGDDAAQHDMFDLFLRDDDQTVVTQLGRRSSKDWVRSLISLSHLNQSFFDLWLDPLEGRLPTIDEEMRRGWIADLARDVFLATAGVLVQDTPLFGNGAQEGLEETQQTQQTIPSSSAHINVSQSSDPIVPSSPLSTASTGQADAAVRRLQLLAPSLNLDKMASAKQSSVLSFWPNERGVGTGDYVSSVALASDQKFDGARQRLKKIETKRKAQQDKYRLPPFMRQSGPSQTSSQVRPLREDPMGLPALPAPPVHIMSSQQRVPGSSQSQGLLGSAFTMSQPVSGAFGDRKKVKKAKKKSGFR